MKEEDLKFLGDILEKSHWLLYGDLDEHFTKFIKEVFKHEFREYGFEEVKMSRDFAVAYWLFLSELVSLDLAEYGTSPRGAWLTEGGERFKKLVNENEDAIGLANDFIYNKYN
jgi:hypothetical protein